MARHSPEDYKALRAYHIETGATDENYWQNLQKRAAAQGQPIDVVYEHYERPGEWACLAGLSKELQRRVMRQVNTK